MARQSRQSRAKALRTARQTRQAPYQPLLCERCGAGHADLSFVAGRMLCGECSESSRQPHWSDNA
jgi:hypothetical protein